MGLYIASFVCMHVWLGMAWALWFGFSFYAFHLRYDMIDDGNEGVGGRIGDRQDNLRVVYIFEWKEVW